MHKLKKLNTWKRDSDKEMQTTGFKYSWKKVETNVSVPLARTRQQVK